MPRTRFQPSPPVFLDPGLGPGAVHDPLDAAPFALPAPSEVSYGTPAPIVHFDPRQADSEEEDEEHDEEEEGARPKKRKSTANLRKSGVVEDSGAGDDREKGRRKISIEFIAKKEKRHITFSKRKAGIMKKAYELATLTGTQVLLLVVSETGIVYTYTTAKFQPLVAPSDDGVASEGQKLIQACLATTGDEKPDFNAAPLDEPLLPLPPSASARPFEVNSAIHGGQIALKTRLPGRASPTRPKNRPRPIVLPDNGVSQSPLQSPGLAEHHQHLSPHPLSPHRLQHSQHSRSPGLDYGIGPNGMPLQIEGMGMPLLRPGQSYADMMRANGMQPGGYPISPNQRNMNYGPGSGYGSPHHAMHAGGPPDPRYHDPDHSPQHLHHPHSHHPHPQEHDSQYTTMPPERQYHPDDPNRLRQMYQNEQQRRMSGVGGMSLSPGQQVFSAPMGHEQIGHDE